MKGDNMTDNQNIRNFCIISHIDHGKSTLADRLIESTQTIEQRKMRAQVLDMMELEREKGITIKLQPIRMKYSLGDQSYLLNLIDTPGHVDFTYEVSRSLAAVEGAILLVDASQGVQAQTLANLHLAQEQNIVIIPMVNKIDLPHAQVKETVQEICDLLSISEDDILKISAKEGIGIDNVFKSIIEKIPVPKGDLERPLRALIFDSSYDDYKGAIAYLKIIDGQIKKSDKVILSVSGARTEVIEVGIFKPEMKKIDCLKSGQIGYLATGLKEVSQCRVGDTIVGDKKTKPLPGYKEPKPVVFASFYPADTDDYQIVKDGLAKLKLNDAALVYEPESSQGLGRGFRCGFLGMLHLEIILERLKREYKTNLVVTSPSVSYQITIQNEERLTISSALDLPEINKIEKIQEPWVGLEVIAPSKYLGQAMKLLEKIRGEYKDTQYLGTERVVIKFEAPLNEIIVDFYDKLKNTTAGYGSMSYEVIDYRQGDLLKMDILVAGDRIEAFSRVVHREKVHSEARALVKKLKEVIPAQLFAVSLQATIGGKIIARETIRALRKDVTGYLYGGDYTRKQKLLEKQKKGKKKMKQIGRVNIPQEVFFKVLKK